MTTACIVKITHCHSPKYRDGRTIYFLRRLDGYPAAAGADVYRAAALATHYAPGMDCHAIVATNHLLTRLVPGAGAHDPQVQLYRPVDSPPDHIRYFYEIDCPPGHVSLNFATGHGPDLEQQLRPFTLRELRHMVNDHRYAVNLGISKLAAQDAEFALHSPYPMLV